MTISCNNEDKFKQIQDRWVHVIPLITAFTARVRRTEYRAQEPAFTLDVFYELAVDRVVSYTTPRELEHGSTVDSGSCPNNACPQFPPMNWWRALVEVGDNELGASVSGYSFSTRPESKISENLQICALIPTCH